MVGVSLEYGWSIVGVPGGNYMVLGQKKAGKQTFCHHTAPPEPGLRVVSGSFFYNMTLGENGNLRSAQGRNSSSKHTKFQAHFLTSRAVFSRALVSFFSLFLAGSIMENTTPSFLALFTAILPK